ncbi:M20/M25/M40 family metallo-hydrolase [Corynebacterium uterequi]|nr:M20/M25/M40 family metallo-hydrolase [Corynebacterium uterequi]
MTTTSRSRIFDDLAQLVSFDSVHTAPDAPRAADWVAQRLQDAGLQVEDHLTVDGSRTIIGRKPAVGEAPTVLLYCHHDVVPAGDRAEWLSDPFVLTERDGRWYGRGAADCKGNVAMHLEVLRQLEATGGVDAGLVVVVEGSEEQGGGGLDALVEQRPELFAADVILIADSGNAAVGEPTLTTALRGGAQVDVTVRTLKTPVHSGIFGGAAPDAVAALARIIDSLRDEAGRTVIDGVDCARSWEGAGYAPDAFRADAGILDGVEILGGDTPVADQVWARPAVSITGFSSTPVDEAVNAVPAVAKARLQLRVPHPLDPQEVAEALAAHVNAHAPWGAQVETTILDVNPTFATDSAKPAAQLFGRCLAEAYSADAVTEVGSGGSIPLTALLQEKFPDAEIILFGVEEPLCGIHGPNESVDPTEIEAIAAAEVAFLRRLR